MRILLLISLMLSVAIAPAAALASCASMELGAEMTAMSPAPDAGGVKMVHDDCADMTDETGPSHGANCAAACALVCPGFFAGLMKPSDSAPRLTFTKQTIPTTGPGVAILSHLDPPPPRI